MEIRDFAERVLFATNLDDKLRPPPVDIDDERPGPAMAAPAMPGRPVELRFKPQGSGRTSDVPGLHRLEDEHERGRLLHFFANHELLATELMALVLLRFPDAPAAFRRGVLATLKDEQEHTRLYLERMRACGIAFGELPVSGYFWRCVSGMENPMDYVAGLSLTFEQANLDFARHFAKGFATVGDTDSARLLDRIYHDEIGHVACGLKWFRRWKNPAESDWEAFCRQLKFPLSPRRAKGFTVNFEGRRAAGLDVQFIAELDVFSQSKGRTPSVYVFNPFAEGHIATGDAFSPNKHQRALSADLACLPQFLCRQDDVVLVPQRPSVAFLSGLKQAGFALPEFVEIGEARVLDGDHELARRKLGGLRPWAWAPDSVALMAPLFDAVSSGMAASQSRDASFTRGIAQLYSKTWSANFLRRLLDDARASGGDPSWLCGADVVGESVVTEGDARAAIDAIRRRGHHRVVVKESLGLAGANAIRLWEPDVTDAQWRWMERAMCRGGELVVEPWLERLADFSIQYEMDERGLRVCGHTLLICDRRGQFVANIAAPNFVRRLPAAIVQAFRSKISAALADLYERIRLSLETDLRRVGFRGPLGLDAFVYRDGGGCVRVKPVVEINPRYTMGRLTVELMRHVLPGKFGAFRIVNAAQLRGAGAPGFSGYARQISEARPLSLNGAPVRKIECGAVVLNDPAVARVCLATFEVGRSPAEMGFSGPSECG